jgi:phosphatidylinositol N-acetylglucosaminyltransferase subunit C
MMLAHLFLHDYRLQVSLTNKATGAASLAAAIFASVVIASRLSSQLHVFSQVLGHI